jgi:FtsH-binding integral membrane protein
MTKLTNLVGLILTVVGIVAYVVSDSSSVTALIPTFIGVILLALGLASPNPKIHKHTIHAALVVALLGALGSLMNVIQIGDLISGDAERPAAIVTSTIMFVVLVAYIAAGVRSFKAARKARNA